MKEENFVGPKIKQLFENHDFSAELNATERRASVAYAHVARNILGNEKANLIIHCCVV
jgi:hypothetical protein